MRARVEGVCVSCVQRVRAVQREGGAGCGCLFPQLPSCTLAHPPTPTMNAHSLVWQGRVHERCVGNEFCQVAAQQVAPPAARVCVCVGGGAWGGLGGVFARVRVVCAVVGVGGGRVVCVWGDGGGEGGGGCNGKAGRGCNIWRCECQWADPLHRPPPPSRTRRFEQPCAGCGLAGQGAVVTCGAGSCPHAFHVLCARNLGLHLGEPRMRLCVCLVCAWCVLCAPG